MMRLPAYERISAVFPQGVIKRLSVLMSQGGVEDIAPRTYLGFVVFFSLAAAVLAFFVTSMLTTDSLLRLSVAPAVFAFGLLVFYLLLAMHAESRAQRIEEVLPEALQIIAANIRSGMTLENAIWSSARSEFGPLKDEIKRVSSDTFSGLPVARALAKMGSRVNSHILERSIRLIAEGISLGGEMAPLLEAVAMDIRNTQLLKKEIATSTLTYTMFIIFAGVIAAPLLFSVSTFYSEINANVLQKQTGHGGGGNMQAAAQRAGVGGFPGMSGAPTVTADSITPQDIYWFSLACIIITTLFAGLIIGQVQSGKALNGIKFVPIFVIVSVLLFHLMLAGLRATVGKLAF